MDSSFSSESGARKGNPCSPTGVPYQLDPRRSFKSNKDRIGQMAGSQCFYLTEIKYTKSQWPRTGTDVVRCTALKHHIACF